MSDDPRIQVRGYHARTKHHLDRYAAGPGRLDWASQPDPFRRFTGAPRRRLPLHEPPDSPSYDDLYCPGATAPRPLTLETLGLFFEFSLGLAAWKQYGSTRWALRCNPSSGNLHPTEGYAVLAGERGGLPADGVYHYLSLEHALEQRCVLASAAAPRRGDGGRQALLPPGCFLVGLSSILWREAWKYGERAWRYGALDIGHALAALRFAAAALGWRAELLAGAADETIAALLGLDRQQDFEGAETESPEALLCVWTTPAADTPAMPDLERLAAAARAGRWQGSANRLSAYHRHEWPVIEEVVRATRKPATREAPSSCAPLSAFDRLRAPARPRGAAGAPASAFSLIRHRRSALGYDARTPLGRDPFLRMLDLALPRGGRAGLPPWDALAWSAPPRIHLLLFVHRVEGFAPGLYLLARRAQAEDALRAAFSPDFAFEPAATLAGPHRLLRLALGDFRASARLIACHQEIAADGAFSLGMLAEFEAALRAHGPWAYRWLFWEAGVLGQLFYLEAEAAGHRGTGIGCFFDDAMHALLGLADERFQSIYHFSVGRPVDDPRLLTFAPYAHLSGRDSG